MRAEPSRRLHGGQAAMESLPDYRTSRRGLSRAQSRVRALLGVGLGALALAGITAATALPSGTKPRPSGAEQRPEPGSVPYLGAAAERRMILPSEEDPH